MPKLLNVILQRFNFNYFTMEREKINDRVEFPFILNFNDYINGYDKIENKLNEDSSEYFKLTSGGSKPVMKKSVGTTKTTAVNGIGLKKKNSTTNPSIAGKTTIKPSANTKSFLSDMRKKKNLQ